MISLILLAGGKGERMNRSLPKQFLPLQEKAIALHSLEVFAQCPEVNEIIVVSKPEYRHYFADYSVQFAHPGSRRQDSLLNGLQKVASNSQWICIHDAARPFITPHMVSTLIIEGKKTGAATLGMPIKATIKEVTEENLVHRTLDRSQIWEIQTPQFIKKEILEKGFEEAHRRNLTITDDVSLAEIIGAPVKLVTGSYQNIKITTPEDLCFATNIESVSPMMEPATAAGKCSPIATLSKE